ncbi:MAG: DNA-binding protein WhiA [Tenericutes bacterium GWC2_34_14]|nr:MAG: DNA-binding protein WhiA [Tenericutes bacterium GWA2_35_7]OHE28154.1 MAG: DNA-binding protein WhiA [Tenericutes bacterium GWC2_34_14]OHE32906.1 MAG: DNA-binding protein WhiA [Tenericutes bacterium GWE2_34_108]OHE36129.1 MAG: DNA-binding protein WhiA [Tenericutes bacterium GWF1_35_14]OHE39352.1 MAG: DNA-binding protein WhiA [Tenericutes bacterium GWF2_35_184]OHE43834.1 MAG: DNA-binding protein WhiA [Tenericutes bacterium RIFOXYA12_FULL_35_10]OHE44626.1 MAG: DNA-binding protein WhiA [Te
MSFAKTVKEELVTVPVELDEQLAEFSAFINLNGEFHIASRQKMLDFKTNNPTVAKRFLQLVRALYQSETSLITQKINKLNQKNAIIIRIHTRVEDIVNEHGLLENPIENQELTTSTPEAKKAFLRAAFLSGGSVNHPKTAEYHLEIYTNNPKQAVFLQSVMNTFDLNAKITKRRQGFICYLKDAEGISDFLQIVGAQNSVFQFEDIRIKRDFNNSINRVMNMEIANERKAIVAANEQLRDIELIETYIPQDHIDLKTKQVIDLRKEYPEASLKELVELFEQTYKEQISKSGLNHRLVKVKQMANELKEGLS